MADAPLLTIDVSVTKFDAHPTTMYTRIFGCLVIDYRPRSRHLQFKLTMDSSNFHWSLKNGPPYVAHVSPLSWARKEIKLPATVREYAKLQCCWTNHLYNSYFSLALLLRSLSVSCFRAKFELYSEHAILFKVKITHGDKKGWKLKWRRDIQCSAILLLLLTSQRRCFSFVKAVRNLVKFKG